MDEKIIYKNLSYQVIGLAMEVHKILGNGFLEKVYENALMIELANNGLEAKNQYPISVNYKGNLIGDYIADILVEDKIILELKSIEKINDIHKVQTKNYLKATGLKLGIILNFGKTSLEYYRVII